MTLDIKMAAEYGFLVLHIPAALHRCGGCVNDCISGYKIWHLKLVFMLALEWLRDTLIAILNRNNFIEDYLPDWVNRLNKNNFRKY